LAGRAAEELVFGKISTGALNDLEKVTKQAYAMVAYFGMNDKLGNISFYDSSGGNEYGFTKPYSERTAELIDQESKKIIHEAYERAKDILRGNMEGLTQLANKLLEEEVIFSEDLVKIFGKRKADILKEEREAKENAKKKEKKTEDKNGETAGETANETANESGNETTIQTDEPDNGDPAAELKQ